MAGKLAQILATKADLVDGKIKIEQVPVEVIQGTKITVSSTPPSNPQPGDLWINSSE
jgi:F420-0:gamma-glutamyl ligase